MLYTQTEFLSQFPDDVTTPDFSFVLCATCKGIVPFDESRCETCGGCGMLFELKGETGDKPCPSRLS